MRRRRNRAVEANPFVAFADLAVAMAFIFAMCTLALSKVLSDMTRDQEETKTQKGFEALMSDLKKSKTETAPWAVTSYDRRRNIVLKTGDQTAGRLSSNGSYQRIELTNAFDFGQIEPREKDEYLSLGNVVKKTYAAGAVDYVFLHPIVEKGELEVAHRKRHSIHSDRDLALARFDALFDLWVRRGIIAEDGESFRASGKIDPKFVVYYGKESLYSNTLGRKDNLKVAGRVDILLFFADHVNGSHPDR